MAWNGSGLFTRIFNWVNDRDASIPMTASRMDEEMDGMAAGITNCITKDGQNSPSANLPMGDFRHTGVGNSTARTSYPATGQVQDGSFNYAADTGTAGAYAIAPSPAITALAAGQVFRFVAANTNSGVSSFAVNGLGTTIKKHSGADLEAGDIQAGGVVTVVYDGTNFQWIDSSAESRVVAGKVSIDVSGSSDVTVDDADARFGLIEIFGALSADINLFLPSTPRLYAIRNISSGGTVTAARSGGVLDVALAANQTTTLRVFGNSVGAGIDNFPAMPTVGGDPIVESGSNADGEWTRWADGTQECRRTQPLTGGSSPATGQFDISWTFPVSFVDANYYAAPIHDSQSGIPASSRGGCFETNGRTTTSCNFRYFTPGSAAHSITSLSVLAVAHGRWK